MRRIAIYIVLLLALTTNAFAQTRTFAFGGLGGVWSSGMIEVCNRIDDLGGACTAYSWRESEKVFRLASEAIARGERVVLLGHSLGADSALVVAARLGNAALVVTFDATSWGPLQAKGTHRLVALYSAGWAPRVSGAHATHHCACGHTDLDEDLPIRAIVLREVRRVTGSGS
jgi:pimeloyl-ACP methyl ester carboxylesterase